MKLDTPLSEALSTKKEYIRALAEMNLRTIRDILLHFPRTYEDLSEFSSILEAKDGEKVTTKGVLKGIKVIPTKSRKVKLVKAMFYDNSGAEAEAVWFNQPHLTRMLPMDKEVIVSGKVQFSYGRVTLQSPEVENIKSIQIHAGATVPVYPQHDVITSKWLREKIHPFLYLAKDMDEILPEAIIQEEGLISKAEAIREIHFPSSSEALKRAQDRLGYEELFLLQLKAVQMKEEWKTSRVNEGGGMDLDPEFVKSFFSTLPFTPTGGQKVAIYEILKDMERPFPMMRLLEGDVGSGKTVVALMAILQAVKHGYQAAIMAPTEVLARQHLLSISQMIGEFERHFPFEHPLNIQLLVGSLKTAEKRQVTDGIAGGQVDIAVGTHALIQETVGLTASGHGMAIDNIRERLQLAFGSRASLVTYENAEQFYVVLSLPYVELK